LVNTLKTAGQKATWLGDDESDKKLPAGIYFIRAENTVTGVSGLLKVLKVE
jgi:hypothetical protein